MENSSQKNITTINHPISTTSIQSNDQKFKKVPFDKDDINILITPSILYKAAIQGCTQVNQKILQIQQYEADTVNFNTKSLVNAQTIDEPLRPSGKITPNIEKVHFTTVSKSISSYKLFNCRKKIPQQSRSKTMTVARFSHKKSQRKTPISCQNANQDQKSINKNTDMLQISRFNLKGQKSIPKAVQKKVRLKINSVSDFSSELRLEEKYIKCIPLDELKPNQQILDSFLENAYRLRKCEIPFQYETSKVWSKNKTIKEEKIKEKVKNNPLSKQNKKIIYEGYDFDGQLIPSTNLPQKTKKPLEQNSQINIQFFSQDNVENLSNYHERQQKNAKTHKDIKIKDCDCENEESQFLANLQKVSWTKNIEYIRRVKKNQQEVQNSKTQIKVKRQHQQKHLIDKEYLSNQKDGSSHDLIQTEELKITNKEELIEHFNRIKFGLSTAEVNEGNNFPFGLSNFVKVKKFQQKKTKSKSYDYHTVNYLSIPFKDFQPEISSSLKLKSQSNKSQEKVRADKRLFRQIFNLSLKKIDPQNRQDILTLKLIKNQDQQSSEDKRKLKNQKNLRRHFVRNSDTILLEKGFCIKPTVFKQNKQNFTDEKDKKTENDNTKSTTNISKSNTIQTNPRQGSNQIINHKAKNCHQEVQGPKVALQNFRKSIGITRQSTYSKNIQKMFKKQTKKTLIKQSAQDLRRQSFV